MLKKFLAFLQDFVDFLRGLVDLLVHLCSYVSRGPEKEPLCQDQACLPALRKPDPFIYCQYYLMSLGYPVTWDNWDIFIFIPTLIRGHNAPSLWSAPNAYPLPGSLNDQRIRFGSSRPSG